MNRPLLQRHGATGHRGGGSYLFGAEADHVGELGDDQVNTLQARLLQTGYLLLNDSLESQIGGK